MNYPKDAVGWFKAIQSLQKDYIEDKASPTVIVFSMLTHIFVFLIQWRFEE